jgi:multidrug transporter EmrE-like cation transporter
MHKSVDLNAPAPQQEKGSSRVSLTSLGLVLFSVIAAASGQLLLKYGMQHATAKAHASGGSLVIAAATTPWVIGGLAVFAISAVAWLGVLSRVSLSVAYPFNAFGYIVILGASIVILHERANLLTWAGSLLVVAGLVIVVLSKP